MPMVVVLCYAPKNVESEEPLYKARLIDQEHIDFEKLFTIQRRCNKHRTESYRHLMPGLASIFSLTDITQAYIQSVTLLMCNVYIFLATDFKLPQNQLLKLL